MSNVPQRIPQIDSVALSGLIEKYDTAITTAIDVGKQLKIKIGAAKSSIGSIDDELDTELNDYLVNLRVTVEKIYNGRLPYTKVMDEIKSIFTAFEGMISPKQKEGIYFDIQRERDLYAQKKKAEADKAARDQELKINKDKERVTLAANAENIIRTSTAEAIATWKRQTNNILETATLETIDGVEDTIAGIEVEGPNADKILALLKSQARYHIPEEVAVIFNEAYSMGLQSDIAQLMHAEVTNYCEHIQKSVPGKKAELEKIASADAANKAALEKQAADRALASQAAINFDLANKTSDIQAEVSAKQQAGVAEVLFNADVLPSAPTGVRNACTIRVLSVKAYPSIMAKWHQGKGVAMSVEDYAKVKVDSMVTYAEKLYLQTGEKIDSADLIYEEVVKTSARK